MMQMQRNPDHPIDSIFLDRWSPRAFDASAMPMADLMTILEAARWAPSAFNVQPWRFLYSQNGDAHWQTYLALLNEFNRSWAQEASALVFILSDSLMPGEGDRPDRKSNYNSFDTGAAWAQLALQATSLGYQAHAMAGIHAEQMTKMLGIPDRYRVEVAVALGKRADPSALPGDLQSRELPSQRRPVREMAFAGAFPG